jgi:dolichol-phosphate mannosyltransferase
MTPGPPRTLIFIPTYNERDNVENMAGQILALGLDADLLFMDDDSPDGTGEILDRLAAGHPRLSIIHRVGKLGIGSAHLDGIRWAFDHGYERLITMDCDFTHTPANVLTLIQSSDGYDVTVGSRYMRENSLPGWNLMRKSLTGLGHFLTTNLLGIPFDATGALRAYDLRRIPRELFERVTASGYAFFFESMYMLVRNNFSVKEFPIVLSARTYGSSKMTVQETLRSGAKLLSVWVAGVAHPSRFRVSPPVGGIDQILFDPQDWNAYWDRKERPSAIAYDFVADAYRMWVIKAQVERFIFKHFSDGSHLLHAGCGSGQVDTGLHGRVRITAIDISPSALRIYRRNNPAAFAVRHATILDLHFPAESFDGVYSVCVLEHFTREELRLILAQFHCVLKPGGKLVIFWPHARATSVARLKGAHWLLNDVLGSPVKFPPADSLLHSRQWVESLLHDAAFRLADYSFGARDFFVQAVVVAEKSKGST